MTKQEHCDAYGSFDGDAYHAIPEKKVNASWHQRLWSRLFPFGYKKEFQASFKLAWPLFLTDFLRILMNPITMMFAGRMGTIQLDGVSLAISVMNVTGISIAMGLGEACDTLFSQTFGAGKGRQMGVILQRSLLILGLACLPCWALHLNITNLLLLLGQDPEVSQIAGQFLLIFMPATLAQFLYQCLAKFLQSQNHVLPSFFVSGTANLINVALQYLLVYHYELGVIGSAIGLCASHCWMFLGTLGYICFSGVHKTTWEGWSVECLHDWGPFCRLAIPSMMLLCLEWWCFEAGIILAGTIGEVELGAQAIVFQTEALCFMIPYGFAGACAIRVGQHLGANRAMEARTACYTAYTIVCTLSVLVAGLLAAMRWMIPQIFTSDTDVIAEVAGTLPILAVYMFFNCGRAAGYGVIKGTGRQFFGSKVSFVAFYIIALPCGIPLMLLTDLKIKGFWIGLMVALIIQCIVFFVANSRLDWTEQMQLAQQRTKSKLDSNTVPDQAEEAAGSREASWNTSETQPLLADSPKSSTSQSGSQIDNKLQEQHRPINLTLLILKRSCAICAMLLIVFVGVMTREYLVPPMQNINTINETLSTYNVTLNFENTSLSSYPPTLNIINS